MLKTLTTNKKVEAAKTQDDIRAGRYTWLPANTEFEFIEQMGLALIRVTSEGNEFLISPFNFEEFRN